MTPIVRLQKIAGLLEAISRSIQDGELPAEAVRVTVLEVSTQNAMTNSERRSLHNLCIACAKNEAWNDAFKRREKAGTNIDPDESGYDWGEL